MHKFANLNDAVTALTEQFGYRLVAANTVAGQTLYGFQKGRGRTAKLAVLAQVRGGFQLRYV